MSSRQVIELHCDCVGGDDCPNRDHAIPNTRCGAVVFIHTNANMIARLTAIEQHLWSVATAPRGTYGGRPAGLQVAGDYCRDCTDWSDPEAVIRAAMTALGYEVETATARLLPMVRRLLECEAQPPA
jgi:hypothetical protein